jgi:pyrroloquinoline quinone biosynthesis protein E
MSAPRPFNLIAELTYRCPLRCPYCSNPLDYARTRDGLSADDWARVFAEAALLGVVHVGLTGGEPSARADLPAIVRAAAEAGLYSLLVTAGRPLTEAGLADLAKQGLRSVQLSLQDADAERSDRIAGARCFDAKLAIARATRSLGLALTLNVVLHRENLDHIDEILSLAHELDADRLELANTQYHGWALENRRALMPAREQLEHAAERVRAARDRASRPEIVFVLPDYYAGRPKPCMGGWGRLALVVTPDGVVLPCHEARSLPGLEFWNARERDLATCWQDAPGMNAFRGTRWMREPCASCPERERDFAGCRCQAFRIAGDAAEADPACSLAPHHTRVASERWSQAREERESPAWRPRGERASTDEGIA